MAVRKTGTRKTATRKTTKKPPSKPSSKGAGNRVPTSAAFWTFLLIVIIIAFFMLLPVIKNLRLNAKATETEQGMGNGEQGTGNREQGAESREQRRKEDEEKKPQVEKPVVTKQPEKKPQVEKPTVPEQPEKKPQTEKPVTPAQPYPPPVKPVETSDRSIYLIKKVEVNNGTSLALVKVSRNINATLTDSINALLAGPAPYEIMSEIESRVPEGSRLLSARVDDGTGTAFLNFNKEFTYNSWGREGCEAQIKQIVWTATEFSNIKKVQFLIEGKEVDFLSEGVVIKNPIGKDDI